MGLKWGVFMKKCNIKVTANDKTSLFDCEKGISLKEALEVQEIFIDSPCGGRGICGKCLVKASGALSKIEEDENSFLTDTQIVEGHRLACLAKVDGDCTVELFKTGKADVEMSTSTMGMHIDRGGNYGAAVDIGTTTVAMYLYDLTTGKRLGSHGEMNEQRAFGADVISRISLVRETEDGLKKLQSTIISQLDEMLITLAKSCHINCNSIDRITLAGNTTMQHLAAGIDISSLGNAPYEPLTTSSLLYKGAQLGFTAAKDADIEFIGSISGYVGADIVAAILSSGLYKAEETSLLIDIGTNGEMALGNKNAIICCSTAAGPAFEGARIRCGCAGIEGAIDRITLSKEGIKFSTIGNKAPIGICGSALIDVMAQLVECEIVTPEGRMLPFEEVPAKYQSLMGEVDGEYGLIISQEPPVFIIPKDVREVQLAKAAICAGIYTLLDHYGIKAKDLPAVYIAGGFGAHINKYNAAKIGLFPAETVERTSFLGNASGAGAIMALLSKDAKAQTEKIREQSTYIELANSKAFQDFYMDCMFFE